MNKPVHYIIFLFFFLPFVLCSQDQSDNEEDEGLPQASVEDTLKEKPCEIKDLGDLFRSMFKKNRNKPPKPPKNFTMLILPNISSNPANGLLLGVGGNLAWFLGPREKTKISLIGFSVAVTTKSQFISFIKSFIYTKENKFFLQGDWRYYKYRAPTYGLGTNAPDTTFEAQTSWQGADISDESGGYPMLYDYLIFHEIVNRKILEHLYAGIGYHMDVYWNIKDELLDLDTVPAQLTPHYAYSKYFGFDSSRYTLSGLSLNLLYDSRDNQISPYKGYYANINYRINPTFLGSDQNSSELWLEFRTYVGLSKKIPRHLLAFWFYGNFQITGHQPYFTLMSLGDDAKNRSGRGYIAGRYRGEDVMYAEVEYRFPILRCLQTLGGVVFVNATTSSNRTANVDLFDYVRPSVGVGLRFLVNKNTRLNINMDFAVGFKSKGFYFSGTEAF